MALRREVNVAIDQTVVVVPYEESGMCLTTYLPFCGNIHANQETKGDISCTPPPPHRIRCQLPDVWGEQLHQQREMKHSWQEKRTKIEAYPPSGISFVSFSLFILDYVLSSVMRGGSERGAYSWPLPSQCPSEWKRLRVLPGGTLGLSQHQLHICSLVADTLMTLADLGMKTLIKNLSSFRSLFLAANRLHMGH